MGTTIESDWENTRLLEELEAARAEIERLKRKDFREMREMLRAMQAGELTVSRGLEILNIWWAGNWNNDMLPPVRQDLIEEDSMPVDIIDRLKQQLAAEQAKNVGLLDFIARAQVSSGVCCCGEPMDGHSSPMSCGHSPVDTWDYAVGKLLDAQPDTYALEAMLAAAPKGEE